MLTVSQLSKSFAGLALFDDVSLQVPAKGNRIIQILSANYLQIFAAEFSLDVVARRSKRIPPGHWKRLRAVLIWSSVFLPLLIH